MRTGWVLEASLGLATHRALSAMVEGAVIGET